MKFRNLSLIFILALAIVSSPLAQTAKRINVGYFEGGKYDVHDLLRNEYFKQLEQILPEEYQIVTIPEGFRTADWKRDNSKDMARQLSRIKHIDMIIAVGPWVVQDLLDAGFDKPILAMHQFNPFLEGLVDSSGKPVAENLTVTQVQGKIVKDLSVLQKLVPIRKLGLLYFPSGDEKEKIYDHFKYLSKNLGFELVIGEGDDNFGTFAFFKAFNSLKGKISALYLPPLWGMDQIKLSEFLKMLKLKRIPAFTYEGNLLLDKGAFATNDYFGIISEARFNAVKTVKILEGISPDKLPVLLKSSENLAVNLQTAADCKIEIPDDIINNYHTLPASLDEDIEVYTISDATSRAVMQNPGFLSQVDALDAAASQASRAYSNYLPHLSGTASYSYTANDFLDSSSIYDNSRTTGSINLDQTILSLGFLKEIRIAAKQHEYQSENLKQSQLDLEYAVALAYLDNLKFVQKVNVLINNRKLTEHNLELAKAKNYYEQSDTLDIIQLENDRYQYAVYIADARKNLKISKVILNSLFNLPAETPFGVDSTLFTEIRFSIRELDFIDKIKTKSNHQALVDHFLTLTFENNPNLKQYDLAINIQNDLLGLNKTRYFPEIGFRGSLDYRDRIRNSNLYSEDNRSWTVGAYLKWSLFSGGDKIKQRSTLNARLSETEYKKDELALELMEKINNDFNRLTAEINKIMTAYQSRARASAALQISLERFITDKISATDLLVIHEKSLKSELALIDIRFEYFKIMAKIIRSTGVVTGENYSNFVDEFHRLAEY